MLRAGPFSDERVIRRVNRRFVPFYFDLLPSMELGDLKARKFVIDAKPEYAQMGVRTPHALVMTPEGKVLAEIDNYATEDEFLAALGNVLAKNSEWNQSSPDEMRIATSGSKLERANLLFDLGREASARRILQDEGGEEESLLLARLCGLAKEWDTLEAAVHRVTSPKFASDVAVERAWSRLAAREFEAVEASLAEVPDSTGRYTEARYLIGLAKWHRGDRDGALAVWKSAIEGCGQDPWIYRADWAYTFAMQGSEKGEFSAFGAVRHSPLGRIGYGGRRPPDLEPF